MNSIEQEVREMLTAKVGRAPGYDEPPPQVLRRARTKRVFTVSGAVLASAALIIAAIVVVQSFAKPALVTTHLVGWRDLQVVPAGGDTPLDLSAPFCRAKDIAFEIQLTSSEDYVQFKNKSPKGRCQLNVPLTVSSLKIFEGARDLGVVGTTHFTHPGFLVTSRPHIIYFQWNSYCGPPLSDERWEMTLPNRGGRISAYSNESVPPCRNVRPGVTFLQAAPAPRVSGSVYLRPSIEAPKRVRPGELLVYKVRLTNDYAAPISFGSQADCPNYHQALYGIDTVVILDRSYQLNCGDAGTVAPGKSVTFEMRLQVPTTMPIGTYTLHWGFQIDALFPGIETTVRVVK